MAKMRSATVRTRVRADSVSPTWPTQGGQVSLVFNLQGKIFMSLLFFFLVSSPLLFRFPRTVRFLRFILRREGILVKYQMRHFYRGFIASTNDKFLGIKSGGTPMHASAHPVRFNRLDTLSKFLLKFDLKEFLEDCRG